MLNVLDLTKDSATIVLSRKELQTIYGGCNVTAFTAAHHGAKDLYEKMEKMRTEVRDVLNSMDTAELPY